jgi:CBS domain-containing protein
MQTIQDIMTRDVQTISPQETVQRAAQLMDELNVGAIPVLDGDKLVGMITDRDITVRSVAVGQAPGSTKVEDVMSTDVRTCTSRPERRRGAGQMGDVQIRRIPVVDEQSRQGDRHRVAGRRGNQALRPTSTARSTRSRRRRSRTVRQAAHCFQTRKRRTLASASRTGRLLGVRLLRRMRAAKAGRSRTAR